MNVKNLSIAVNNANKCLSKLRNVWAMNQISVIRRIKTEELSILIKSFITLFTKDFCNK